MQQTPTKGLSAMDQAAERAMADIIKGVPGFNPPRQERSWSKTFSILSVAASLLREKDFSEISMQQIAEGANCAVTAIYARFPDKETLLAAINVILIELYRPISDEEFASERFRSGNIYDIGLFAATISEKFHIENSNFIRAAVTSSNTLLYKFSKSDIKYYAERFNVIISPILHTPPDSTLKSIEFALRLIAIAHRDGVMGRAHFAMPQKEALSRLFVMVVKDKLVE